MIYDEFHEIGKRNIRATRSDFTDMIGEDGLKDIIRNVFLGGNVLDTTEFITQRRLIRSFAATYELFLNHLSDKMADLPSFVDSVCAELQASSAPSQTFYDWLLGLTKKGFDNIVRKQENMGDDYEGSL